MRDLDLPETPLPQGMLATEQRMAGRALMAWRLSQRSELAGFEDNAILIADPGGEARIVRVSPSIAAAFGLQVGQRLCDTPPGTMSLENELRDACDLVALGGQPIPLEISLTQPDRPVTIVRGIALPLAPTADTPPALDRVQIIINWRELLSRSATGRLKRELGAALQSLVRSKGNKTDPFANLSA